MRPVAWLPRLVASRLCPATLGPSLKLRGLIAHTCLHAVDFHRYGWRYQIAALAKAGFRCIVPSCLGYAESSKPDDLAAYGFKALSRDLQELLQAIQISDKVLLYGHDW